VVTFCAGSANAVDRSAEGKAILHKQCGRCHAIETAGESSLKTALPMRDIYDRYATRELQEELLEGMVSRHKEMPQISFSPFLPISTISRARSSPHRSGGTGTLRSATFSYT
jgi:mono/diheme cytochrome c family protein